MPIRVLIVDRHEVMRAGIKAACTDRAEIELVGDTDSLVNAVEIARHRQPEVAIVDPEACADKMSGQDAVARMHQLLPDMKILVFAGNNTAELASQFIDAGASGYLTKEAGLDEVAVAIRAIHGGRMLISHSHPNRPVATPLTAPRDRDDVPPLSAREREVLAMLADGMTNKQVAQRLFLSVKTVETYRARIMKKYDLSDRAQLVQLARRTLGQQGEPQSLCFTKPTLSAYPTPS